MSTQRLSLAVFPVLVAVVALSIAGCGGLGSGPTAPSLSESELISWKKFQREHKPAFTVFSVNAQGVWLSATVKVTGEKRMLHVNSTLKGCLDNAASRAAAATVRAAAAVDLTSADYPFPVQWFADEGHGIKQIDKAPTGDVERGFNAFLLQWMREAPGQTVTVEEENSGLGLP